MSTVPKRAMNNQERANAKTLKEKGFYVFWFQTHDPHSQCNGYWATHPKLVFQYNINTAFSMALEDLSKQQTTNNKQ